MCVPYLGSCLVATFVVLRSLSPSPHIKWYFLVMKKSGRFDSGTDTVIRSAEDSVLMACLARCPLAVYRIICMG